MLLLYTSQNVKFYFNFHSPWFEKPISILNESLLFWKFVWSLGCSGFWVFWNANQYWLYHWTILNSFSPSYLPYVAMQLGFHGDSQYCIVTIIKTSLQQVSCACSMKCKMHSVELKAFVCPQGLFVPKQSWHLSLWPVVAWSMMFCRIWVLKVRHHPCKQFAWPFGAGTGLWEDKGSWPEYETSPPWVCDVSLTYTGTCHCRLKGKYLYVKPTLIYPHSSSSQLCNGLGWCLWPRSIYFNQVMVTYVTHIPAW